jgi:hypothetical protein
MRVPLTDNEARRKGIVMGQAKLRGSLEDRKRQALQRKADEARRVLRDRIARDAAMTAEEKQKRRMAMMVAALAAGLAPDAARRLARMPPDA